MKNKNTFFFGRTFLVCLDFCSVQTNLATYWTKNFLQNWEILGKSPKKWIKVFAVPFVSIQWHCVQKMSEDFYERTVAKITRSESALLQSNNENNVRVFLADVNCTKKNAACSAPPVSALVSSPLRWAEAS